MSIDYQKREAKNCLWNMDGENTAKKARNKGKGRWKEKREIWAAQQEMLEQIEIIEESEDGTSNNRG